MTVHFIHVGKTGGTALKRALLESGCAYREHWDPERAAPSRFGRVVLHHHRFKLRDVPPGDFAFFAVRDPVSRFLSGFYSRLNKGQPRFYYEWTDGERAAFEAFPTPQLLAAALASADAEERRRAAEAMRSVRHLRRMRRQLGTPRQLRARRRQILYVATQETLDRDWEHLKVLLGLQTDAGLPHERATAHRGDPSANLELDEPALRALREWYRNDYELLRYCDRLRAWRGWDTDPLPAGGPAQLVHQLARVRGIPALLPIPAAPRRSR